MNSFCHLPWTSLGIGNSGNLTPCCVIGGNKEEWQESGSPKEQLNGKAIRELRLQFLKGEKPAECHKCFGIEAKGGRSHRVQNGLASSELQAEILEATRSDGRSDFPKRSFDLRLGNKCNLKCRMCLPGNSNLVRADWQKLPIPRLQSAISKLPEDKNWPQQNEFWQDLLAMSDTVEKIVLSGGEPTVVKNHYRFLNELASLERSEQIDINYHSNMMLPVESIEHYLRSFRSVTIRASIDAVGGADEFIRYPSKWDVVEKNIREISRLSKVHSNLTFEATITIQAMNLARLVELIDYLRELSGDKQFLPIPNLLYRPDWMSVWVLPYEYRRQAVKELLNYFEALAKENDLLPNRLQRWINHIEACATTDQASSMDEFFKINLEMDKIRSQNLLHALPEFATLYNQTSGQLRLDQKSDFPFSI